MDDLWQLKEASIAQQAIFAEKKFSEYKKHLKHIRIFIWVALVIFSLLFYWYGETDRYRHAGQYYYLDTKTGKYYDANGKPFY